MARFKSGPTKSTSKPTSSKSIGQIAKTDSGRTRVKKRAENGSKALKEIRTLRRTTNLLIAKAPFIRVVREIIQSFTGRSDFRITEAAVEALREASEATMTNFFEDAYLLCNHAKRQTLFVADILLLKKLRVGYDTALDPAR